MRLMRKTLLLNIVLGLLLGSWQPARPAIAEETSQASEVKDETTELSGSTMIAIVGTEILLASEILPVVDEMLEMQKNQLTPEEFESRRRDFIKGRLPALIEIKLVYLDAKKKIPKEAWTKITPQVDKLFDQQNVPAMLQVYKVATRGELDEIMRKYGTSIEAQRQAFLERSVATQFKRARGKDDAERETYLRNLRERTFVWTMFDPPQAETSN